MAAVGLRLRTPNLLLEVAVDLLARRNHRQNNSRRRRLCFRIRECLGLRFG